MFTRSPFSSWFLWDNFFMIPEGYELIEKTEHKEQRIKDEIKKLKRQKEFATKRLKELENPD